MNGIVFTYLDTSSSEKEVLHFDFLLDAIDFGLLCSSIYLLVTLDR